MDIVTLYRAACLCVAAALTAPAAGAEERSEFDVLVAGITAGAVTLVVKESGGRYEAQGALRSSGLVAGLYRIAADVAASGRVNGNSYRPSGYVQNVTERGETKKLRFRWTRGGLEVERTPPDDDRPDHYAGPEGMGDALDPLTGLVALLRDRPADLACDLRISVYNGDQRAGLRLSGGTREGDRLVCPGLYTREAGYSAEELAERTRWNFQVTYGDAGDDMLRVEEVRLRSDFGPMVVRRR